MEMRYDQYCFACGKDNPVGLKLNFTEDNGKYITSFTPPSYYQGYPGILHGGITSTILDEIMGRYLYHKGYIALTADLSIRYKKPIPVEEPLKAIGSIVSQKARMIEMQAQIILNNGIIAAEAKGKFMIKGTI